MKINIKKLFVSVLSVIMIGTTLSTTTFAASASISNKLIKTDSLLLDTTNSEIGVEIYVSEPVKSLRYSKATDFHSGRFYLKSDNSTLGEFKVTGEFKYDGTLCNVTKCQTSVWNVADGWRVEVVETKEQVSPTLGKAVGEFKLYKERSSGDTLSSSATITISCTHKGKTNTEFNGDEATS